VSCARPAQTVKGKYKTTRKKVVTNFSKQQTGRISFLNPAQQCRLPSFCAMSSFFPSDYVTVLTKSL
jgi:hypothetical protein